jgi:SAM domain (Sterile alpha motif)
MDLAAWLRRLGLEQYEAAFRENEIDETVLSTRLTWRIATRYSDLCVTDGLPSSGLPLVKLAAVKAVASALFAVKVE